MTIRIAAALLMCATALSDVRAQTPSTAAALTWIGGCWTRDVRDGVNEEQWMAPLGGSMLGMSRTVRAGKTVEFEFLRITEVNGVLAYIAMPSGQKETTFPVKTLTEREVVFENPTHDFPQRVIYRRTGDAALTARIEGTMNGQQRGMDFPFTRCR